MKETLFEDLLYYEGNEGSQKAGKIGSFKRNAFRRGPEWTQELASAFRIATGCFIAVMVLMGSHCFHWRHHPGAIRISTVW